ncbi:MAG TPA: ABC transporter ATP-binding protein [Bryobacteraceae bacterium]|jgi:ABC-2 type transport system ATP-binding protein|nr:ABC transporter ATP-binding protein [Bryobacteraceae bacterium]
MISCHELNRRFGDQHAVEALTFQVEKGAICAFLGANGAGKSTTVKMLTGLLAPTSGAIEIRGIDVVKNPLAIRRISGVLPEDLGLFDDLTVEEHLMLTGRIYGLDPHSTRQRASELLRALNLTEGRNTFAAQCSHGMRKKTAFAMALLPNPEVLFLDEPFEAIDPVTAKLMRDLLVALSRRGITIFLTSHVLSVVERIATQLVIIREGKCVWNSPASELPRSLEDLYFELAESANPEPLEWLGSPLS